MYEEANAYFPQPPLMLISCIIRIKYHKQEIDMLYSIKHIQISSTLHAHTHICTYIYVCGCVFVSLYAVLSQSVYLAVSSSQDSLILSLYSYLLSLSPYLWATTNLFSISIIMLFHKCYTNRSCGIYSFDNGFFHSA